MAQPNKLLIKYHPAEGKISFKDLGGSLKDFTGNVSNYKSAY